MADVADIVVEQTTSAGFAEGAVTVDYPSGIAEDDLMIMILFCRENDSLSTPSGWTVISNDTTVFGGDVDSDVYVYRKVVTSGDVSAGSLSVDVDDGTGEVAYVVFRFSGYNSTTPTEQVDSGNDSDSGTSRNHTVSITPSTADSILIMCTGYDGESTTGSYSCTGSPSFTEVADFQASATGDTVAVAYSTVEDTSEITTLDFTSGTTTTRSQALGFIVRTSVTSTNTVSPLIMSNAMGGGAQGSFAITVPPLSISHSNSATTSNSDKTWTGRSKGSGSWTGRNK